MMHEKKSQPDQPSSSKPDKAPKGSGFICWKFRTMLGGKSRRRKEAIVPLKWIRDAVEKVAQQREQLLTQYKLEHAKASRVFINCPFDAEYKPLFDAMVFAVFDSASNHIARWKSIMPQVIVSKEH